MSSSPRFRVLVADTIEAEGLAALREAGLEVDARSGLDEAPLMEAVKDADALLVRSRTKVSARAIESAPRLRLITRAGIGVDNVDLAAASRRGVIVTNVPDASTTTTAELAVTLLLALARRIPAADRNVRAGRFDRAKFLGTEIAGKTLGVIGLGRIGRIVADRALGLKMRVIAHDPFLPKDASPIPGVALVDLDECLATADFLTLHVPLLESTRHLIGEAALAKTKRGVRIVNASRGGIVDEAALATAVRSGHVAGAALDVTEVEPLPPDSELRALDAVILTPHLGASTEEAQLRVAIEAAAQIVEFAKTGRARNAVNDPALPDDLREELGPYLVLAERLGAFAGCFGRGRVTRVAVAFRGERFERAGGERATAPLRAAILVGLLRPTLDADVTRISAPILARERGIEVLESREPRDRDFVHRIALEVAYEGGAALRIDGTCFGRVPSLVALEGVSLDAVLEGDLLVTRHHDRPGMVGRIGTLLGERGVNLDRVDLGSIGGGGDPAAAVGVFGLSGEIPGDLVASVRALPGVFSACSVRLPRGR